MKYRIGHSQDVHRFEKGRPLILGGVNIPFERGLAGHSDADCVFHAVSEAIIGAWDWAISEPIVPTQIPDINTSSLPFL